MRWRIKSGNPVIRPPGADRVGGRHHPGRCLDRRMPRSRLQGSDTRARALVSEVMPDLPVLRRGGASDYGSVLAAAITAVLRQTSRN